MSNHLKLTTPVKDNSLKGYYAGFVSRFMALVIDIIVLSLIMLIFHASVAIVLNFFNINVSVLLESDNRLTTAAAAAFILLNLMISLFMWVFYFVGAWVLVGQTVGKRILGLKVTSLDGSLPTFKQALVRYAGYWLSAIPLFTGFLWVLVDDERRGWHDKISYTCVIYSWDARRGPWLQQKLLEAQAIEAGKHKTEAQQIPRQEANQAAGGSTGSQTKKRLPG
ncbi:MAG TPA: RDD family protein [Anaerolineae bacterium]|nr:RDD family protein [Anaerolineae bacterium]